VAFSTYNQPACAGVAQTTVAVTTGCVCVPGGLCYQGTCDGSSLSWAEYTSSTDCSGTASFSGTYTDGCTTVDSISYQQSSCSNGGASVDWNGYLKTWLQNVGQSWTIPTFSTTTFYKSNSQWTINGDTVSVDITFSSAQDSDVINGFVAKVCTDIIQNANSGVCDQATTQCVSNPDPVHADCTWITVSKKRQSQSSVITLNAAMNSGVMLSGLLGLIATFLVLLL